MEYATLGSSGLKISRIALGCMSFGDTSRGFNEWALGDEAAEPIFRQAVELGITFRDTANAYGYGTSEEITGRAIRTYTRREDVVLAAKVFFKMHDGPGGSGLSPGRPAGPRCQEVDRDRVSGVTDLGANLGFSGIKPGWSGIKADRLEN